MVVIKVITAFAPDMAELTIVRYEGRGPKELQISQMTYVAELTIVRYESRGLKELQISQIAYVKVPGNLLALHLVKQNGQWFPRQLDVPSSGLNLQIGSGPGTYTVGETRNGYVFTKCRR